MMWFEKLYVIICILIDIILHDIIKMLQYSTYIVPVLAPHVECFVQSTVPVICMFNYCCWLLQLLDRSSATHLSLTLGDCGDEVISDGSLWFFTCSKSESWWHQSIEVWSICDTQIIETNIRKKRHTQTHTHTEGVFCWSWRRGRWGWQCQRMMTMMKTICNDVDDKDHDTHDDCHSSFAHTH